MAKPTEPIFNRRWIGLHQIEREIRLTLAQFIKTLFGIPYPTELVGPYVEEGDSE